MDHISIKNLKAQTTLGIYSYEQAFLANIIINISFSIDVDAFAKNDDINDTIDYQKLSDDITAWMKIQKTQLLETLSYNLLEFIKINFKPRWVKLSITKVAAINNSSDVTITVERDFN